MGLGPNAQGMMEPIIPVNNPRHQGLGYKHATTRTKRFNPSNTKNVLQGVQHLGNQVSSDELGNLSAIVCLILSQANIVTKANNVIVNDILTTMMTTSSTHTNGNNVDIWLASASSASSSSSASDTTPAPLTRPESIIQGLRNMMIRPASPRNLPQVINTEEMDIYSIDEESLDEYADSYTYEEMIIDSHDYEFLSTHGPDIADVDIYDNISQPRDGIIGEDVESDKDSFKSQDENMVATIITNSNSENERDLCLIFPHLIDWG